MEFGFGMVKEAYDRIRGEVRKTPMIRLEALDEALGCRVYVKADCMQKTGSFKFRGAMNAVMSLSEEELKGGIVTASSGNHGRACAYAAKMKGIPATVVIPDSAPEIKVQNILALGAEVVQCPAVERFKVAERISAEKKAVFIPPYDDYNVMAGQGSAGIEIMEQLPDVETVIVPMSGGGLMSGISTAVRELGPSVRIVGAEPAPLPRYTESLAAGKPVNVPQQPTVADALVSNHPGGKCFPVIKKNVDEIADVPDSFTLKAQKLLLTEGKIFAEPSSAIGMAAVMAGLVKVRPDEKVCFFVSGGNLSIGQLDRLKEL